MARTREIKKFADFPPHYQRRLLYYQDIQGERTGRGDVRDWTAA